MIHFFLTLFSFFNDGRAIFFKKLKNPILFRELFSDPTVLSFFVLSFLCWTMSPLSFHFHTHELRLTKILTRISLAMSLSLSSSMTT